MKQDFIESQKKLKAVPAEVSESAPLNEVDPIDPTSEPSLVEERVDQPTQGRPWNPDGEPNAVTSARRFWGIND